MGLERFVGGYGRIHLLEVQSLTFSLEIFEKQQIKMHYICLS